MVAFANGANRKSIIVRSLKSEAIKDIFSHSGTCLARENIDKFIDDFGDKLAPAEVHGLKRTSARLWLLEQNAAPQPVNYTPDVFLYFRDKSSRIYPSDSAKVRFLWGELARIQADNEEARRNYRSSVDIATQNSRKSMSAAWSALRLAALAENSVQQQELWKSAFDLLPLDKCESDNFEYIAWLAALGAQLSEAQTHNTVSLACFEKYAGKISAALEARVKELLVLARTGRYPEAIRTLAILLKQRPLTVSEEARRHDRSQLAPLISALSDVNWLARDIHRPEVRDLIYCMVDMATLSIESEAIAIPDGYACPISAQFMKQPVAASCGHPHDFVSIQSWSAASPGELLCTTCRTEAPLNTWQDCRSLRSDIAAWRENFAAAQEVLANSIRELAEYMGSSTLIEGGPNWTAILQRLNEHRPFVMPAPLPLPAVLASATSRVQQVQAPIPPFPGFVEIPPGVFRMGATSADGSHSLSGRIRSVMVTHYYELKETPVTEHEWQEVMGNNPSQPTRPDPNGVMIGFSRAELMGSDQRGVLRGRPLAERPEDCPVTNINWYDAIAYCNRLSERAGIPPYYILTNERGTPGAKNYFCNVAINRDANARFSFRLPTEAEYELAARESDFDDRRLYRSNIYEIARPYDGIGRPRTLPVRFFQPNTRGLYGMIGSVWQWCSAPYRHPRGAQGDAIRDPDGVFESIQNVRSLRGGGVYCSSQQLGAHIRFEGRAEKVACDYGMRPARTRRPFL